MFERDTTFSQPIIWTTTLFMIAFHVGAIAALFFFSEKALALASVLWWIFGSLASFTAKRPGENHGRGSFNDPSAP